MASANFAASCTCMICGVLKWCSYACRNRPCPSQNCLLELRPLRSRSSVLAAPENFSVGNAEIFPRRSRRRETENPNQSQGKRRLHTNSYNSFMYHYDPNTALEELTEEAALPNPVHVRDMLLRKKLTPDQSLELNRMFVEYQKFFSETQKLGKEILKQLAAR